MTEYTFTSQGRTFTRVSKTAAKKAYINGFTIALCPCRLRPGAPWYPECIVNRETLGEDTADAESEFNSLLNQFEFYNCTNETGRYTAFFIESDHGYIHYGCGKRTEKQNTLPFRSSI